MYPIQLLVLLQATIFLASAHPVLIVVSYDAFRHDFINLHPTVLPRMSKLREMGTYADYLLNVFPTKTFPNHHSIATGLYPETHGVVGNSFYDPLEGKVVNISYEMYHYNEDIKPIWRWNEEFSGRFSGSMMWPGASYPYQNKTITYSKSFDPKYDWFKRIDDVISWIKNPVKPANLVMVYFEEPDTHGHAFGPNSNVVLDLLGKLDNISQYLQDKLQEEKLLDKVSVVHLSDHGLIAVKPPQFLNITQYLVPETYIWAGASPCLEIIPKTGHEDDVYNRLKTASANNNFTVYKKADYPSRWHYGKNRRSPPILVMADVDYALDDLIIAAPQYARKYHFNLTSQWEFGVHGYDNTVDDMHGIFMARGPKIRKNHTVLPFETVDLFDLFCKILDIPPNVNNGSTTRTDDVLCGYKGKFTVLTILITTIGGILLALTLISLAVIITLVMVKRQQSITTTAALNKRFPQSSQQTVIEAQHLLESEEA